MTDREADREYGPDGGTVEATSPVALSVDEGVRSRAVAVGRIAAREYRVAMRSRWGIGLAVLFGVFAVGVVGFGASAVGPDRYAAVVASLAELAVYLVPLAALAAGYDAVAGAEESGTLDMLFALPVSRAEVLVGTYLGRAAVLAGGMLLGLSAGGVVAVGFVGLAEVGTYARFALAATLSGCAFLAVSVLISTLAREKTRALGGALIAWVWFVLLHDLAVLGMVAATEVPGGALAVAVLANPVDLFRVLVLSGLETAPGGFAAVLAETGLSAPVLVLGLLAWIAVPMSIAARAIRNRRL